MPIDGHIVLVGAGNMGGAILRGWIDSGIDPAQIFVADPNLSIEFIDYLNGNKIAYGAEVPEDLNAACLVLAIKPQMMSDLLPALADRINAKSIIISIAAGTSISFIKSHLKSGLVIRAMPNTPAMIGRGITGLACERAIDDNLRAAVAQLMAACGMVEWVDSEDQLNAVTALSGSGPAYVFYLAEVMAAAGRKLGLDEDMAMRLAKETVSGAGELMRRSDDAPNILRENVTSPGGTTAAALKVLMQDDAMTALFYQALEAAKVRAEELAS